MRGNILNIQEVLLFIFYSVLVFYVIALGLNYILPNDAVTLIQYNMALAITSFLGLVFIILTKK